METIIENLMEQSRFQSYICLTVYVVSRNIRNEIFGKVVRVRNDFGVILKKKCVSILTVLML